MLFIIIYLLNNYLLFIIVYFFTLLWFIIIYLIHLYYYYYLSIAYFIILSFITNTGTFFLSLLVLYTGIDPIPTNRAVFTLRSSYRIYSGYEHPIYIFDLVLFTSALFFLSI